MKNRSIILFTGIIMLFAVTFIQCDPVSGPGTTPKKPDPSGPPAGQNGKPELIAPANGADDQPVSVQLKWKKQNGVKEYTLTVSEDKEFSSPLIETQVEGNSHTLDELSHETTYYWRVIPKADRSTPSDVWSFTTAGEGQEPVVVTPELTTPEDKAVLESGQVEFEWKPIAESSGYHIQIAKDEGFEEIEQDTVVAETSYRAGDLTPGELWWRVAPVMEEGAGDWSETRSFTLNEELEDPTIPAVSLESPSDGSTESLPVTLSWNAVDGFEEYQIQISGSRRFRSILVDEKVSGNRFEADGLDEGENYYWRVRITDGSFNGEWSDIRSFETESAPSNPGPQNPNPQNPNPRGFVQTQNGDFVVDGQVFRFAGTNAYYLPNYQKIDPSVVDRAFNAFEEAGITVVRMWAFYDGYDCGYSRNDRNENVIQTAPGVYSEQALRDLDRVIAKGKEKGIRFILPFVNYWDELGGICQYNTWAGVSNPSRNMQAFIDNPQTQKWFRDYISMLLNRVNTVTGVAYKDEPAIFAWQIINEGRLPGRNPTVIRDWYQEIARYIKSIDPNHLVGTGEEGFDEGTPSEYSVREYSNTYVLRSQNGTSYLLNTAIPEIDFGTAHWYGPDYGFGQDPNETHLRAQRAWISDHARIAEELGKPFFIGEYGYPGWGDNRVLTSYRDFWNHAESVDLDGSLLWQLTADYVKCYEFGGNICWPAGRADQTLFREFQQHIQTMDNSR